jgi:membrane protein DedA with SNARE-associated domain
MSAGELYVYLGIFAALVAAGLGFPIPEEVPVVTAGALAGQVDEPVPPATDVAGLLGLAPAAVPAGLPWAALYRCANPERDPNSFRVRWWVLLPVCILGVVFSDALLYGLGLFFGTRLLEHRFLARLVPRNKRERIENNFHRYGIQILLFARFMPGIRAPIFVTAGIMRLPLRRFLLADGLYAIPGVSLLFSLAFWFTNSFKDLVERAEAKVAAARPLVILGVVVGVAVYLVIHFMRRPVPVGDPEEMPILGPQVAAHLSAEGDSRPPAGEVSRAPGEPLSNGQPQERREPHDTGPRT